MHNTKKILLLLPPSFLYPMGAAYVAATIENAGYDYDIYGFFYDNRSWFKKNRISTNKDSSERTTIQNISANMSQEYLFETIDREKYDYILVGGLVGFFRWFYQMLPPIKGYNPKCKIIMGGGITKDLAENIIFEKLAVDYILKGEAETNLIELLTLLSKEKTKLNDLSRIPGLCWKDSASAIRKNTTIRFDLEKNIIRPAWDSFHINEYISLSDTLFRFNKTFFPILAGRGCPNVCQFCSPSIGRFTPCSIDSVISEIKYWVKKYKFDFFFIYSEVAFDDEIYTQNFCRRYIKEVGKPWAGQIRTDVQFSVETYRLIKESGCMFINMGFESSNDRILKIMKKKTTFNDHMRNLKHSKEAGINVFGNFMFGHETETAEEIRETFDYLNNYDLINGPSNGLAKIIVYPGTGYYRNAEKKGLIDDPFKFLLSYSMKAGISDWDIRKNDANRLNISALSDDEFYEVVCTENIKHRRLYSKRHSAVDVERRFIFNKESNFLFKGKCPTCGSLVDFDLASYHNPLNITTLCHCCYYITTLDIYKFTETEKYLEYLKFSINDSKKIVVYGSWIMELIFCGALSIPYEKIIAWVDPENPDVSSYDYFYHMPQLSLEEIKIQGYDMIISLKPRSLTTPRIIEEHGLNPHCKIINIAPDILNIDICKVMERKTVAIAGGSDSVVKVRESFISAHLNIVIDNYSNINQICNADVKYDFIIYDKYEFDTTRQELAQNSNYLINEILYTIFLLDGGYYAKC
ncbi:MAG: radical SAM protein [Desulfamplus sp.]|nr:radical SAM protein [Desulfamplus sp.]